MGGSNVVLWGDSMVRQLYNRLPSLFRGQQRTIDGAWGSAMRYDVCECVFQPPSVLSMSASYAE